jgi:hypothetical protein
MGHQHLARYQEERRPPGSAGTDSWAEGAGDPVTVEFTFNPEEEH